MKYNSWDLICLDSIGFWQVRDPQEKLEIEKEVVSTFFNSNPELKVPDEFAEFASFKWKSHSHDFGTYWDYNIYYNRGEVEEWEFSEDEEIAERYNIFWDWANNCESAISKFEEKLVEICSDMYRKKCPMTIVHKRTCEFLELLKVM